MIASLGDTIATSRLNSRWAKDQPSTPFYLGRVGDVSPYTLLLEFPQMVRSYEVKTEEAMNTLGMHIVVYKIIRTKDGVEMAESRYEEVAQFIANMLADRAVLRRTLANS